MGLSIFAKTRKKSLVEMLHEHGICISYDRVQEISAQLGNATVSKYVEEGVVCPPVLRKGLFTTAVMDKIDHNASATTATTYFHGTSISMFQHPTKENKGEERHQPKFEVQTADGFGPQVALEYQWLEKVSVTEEKEGAITLLAKKVVTPRDDVSFLWFFYFISPQGLRKGCLV